jgi:hypothetical protein
VVSDWATGLGEEELEDVEGDESTSVSSLRMSIAVLDLRE